MKLDLRPRTLLLGGALAATLIAAVLVDDGSSGKPAAALVSTRARATATASAASDGQTNPGERLPKLALDKLRSRGLGTVAADPFRLPASRKPAPNLHARSENSQSQAAPTAPPLPFTYMGKLVDGEGVRIFLAQGDRNLVVRTGETIERTYRVDRIDDDGMTLTYLPLDQRQVMKFGDGQ